MIDPSPLLIGTAGWSIPAADAASFPAAGTLLERYATTMSAVEINSSFHRPHRRSTYERWAASTPERFRFSVKIPKAISHVRRLVDADELLVSFVEQIEGLADRLSVLLLQLPPSLAFASGVAASFFATLRHKIKACGHLAHCDFQCREVDHGAIALVCFLVSCSDTPECFQAAEEVLDQVPPAIGMEVAIDLLFPVRFGRDHHYGASFV